MNLGYFGLLQLKLGLLILALCPIFYKFWLRLYANSGPRSDKKGRSQRLQLRNPVHQIKEISRNSADFRRNVGLYTNWNIMSGFITNKVRGYNKNTLMTGRQLLMEYNCCCSQKCLQQSSSRSMSWFAGRYTNMAVAGGSSQRILSSRSLGLVGL